jgi:protein SCO1/2
MMEDAPRCGATEGLQVRVRRFVFWRLTASAVALPVALSIALPMAIALSVLLSGCRGGADSAASASKAGPQPYAMRGTVVATDAADGEVTLRHDAIAGLMPAMTMPYRLQDPAALSELHPGDVMTATLLADKDAAGPKNLRLTDIVIVAEGKPDYKPTVQYHLPTPGDVVPDFSLLNQSGKTIDLKRFRGKVLAMTFIYTRCPLSDYCPRMSHNFAEMDKTLEADPKLARQTHLLSVSFDPEYDTPKVLKSYGEAYTGRYVKETFEHWDFAAPPLAELPAMEQYFSVGVTPGEKGTLQHSLSTVVIGKDGKVIAFYPTNDWTVVEVLAKMKAATN